MRSRRARWLARALLLSIVCTSLDVIVGGGTAAAAIPVYSTPALREARFIGTNPIVGTTIKPRDDEGLAYVPADHSLWLADDNGHKILELDPDTGALKRQITQATWAAAVRYGGTEIAGENTASDFEAMAYDQINDIIYVFAGKCCDSSVRAAAFRMLRDANGVFQVESFQPFTAPMNDFSGMDDVNGEIWAALDKTIYKYDYTTNTFSHPFTVSGISGSIVGMGFSPDGNDLWMTTGGNYLYRMNWNSRTLVPAHSFDMTAYGVLDPRSVEVVGDQLFICDGYDSYASDYPQRYAIRVYDVVDASVPVAPVASFTKSSSSGVAPLTVQFTDTSMGAPTSWSWDFGDGSAVSTAQHPSHNYSTVGTYNVTLTASNAHGSSTSPPQTVTVGVPAAPVASFAKSTSSGVAPLTVQFTDTSLGAPTSWSWNFGDGSAVSSSQHPSHSYAAVGTYSVTLTASNAHGSTTSPPQSVTVTVAPITQTFTSAKDAFVNSSSPAKNYGTTYDYLRLLASTSEYRSYIAFDVSCVTASITSAVLRLYVTDASSSGGSWYSTASTWTESTINWNNAPAINGAPIATAGPAAVGSWIEIDVTSAVTGDGTYSFAGLTTSASSLRMSSKEGANAPQLVVTLGDPVPAAPVASFTTSSSSGVAPLAVQFTDTSLGAPTSWSWDFGDGAVSSSQHPLHSYAAAGTYNVTLTASNAHGSTTSPPQSVTVTVAPITQTFTSTNDAFVNSSSPTKNYGTTYDYLRLLASLSEYRSYVAFDVSGVTTSITSAVLRLYVTDASNSGGSWYSTASTWTESTINWTNAPAINGPPIATVGPAAAGWIEIDVTAAVTGDGTYSFAGLTTSTNSLRMSSKEGANAPQLVLTMSSS